MPINLHPLQHYWENISSFFTRNLIVRKYNDEQPLRSELYSITQLERHAEDMANRHIVKVVHGPDLLLSRLNENEDILLDVYDLVSKAAKEKRRLVPAAEWLIDNFYLLEEQIGIARRHLPKDYSRELPRIQNGPSAGFPRVYDIAQELISHVDGRVNSENVTRFVAAYQRVSVLKLGELWAIPIMLRLALIENLRRVAIRISVGNNDRKKADYWADRMIDIMDKDPKNLVLEIADMSRSNPPLSSAFIAELARRLQGQSSSLALPLAWIELHVAERGITIEQYVSMENHNQAADQVSIGNSIGSLRFLGIMNWKEFIESLSVVEQTLHQDPSGVYKDMNFATRDRYRHVIEKYAKDSKFSEVELAQKVVHLAQDKKSEDNPNKRISHIGYYLIDKGLPQFENIIQVKLGILEKINKVVRSHPLSFYLGSLFIITVLITAIPILLDNLFQLGFAEFMVFTILLFYCSGQLGVTLINWISTLLVKPNPLPKMDYSHGIPKEFSTLVTIPTFLASKENINHLLEGIEIRFLSNRDENLRFCLLTDFKDAPKEIMPEDDELLRYAKEGIEELNKKYGNGENNIFYLLHRPRLWNPRENCWMGYERKRGKLIDLNFVLRGRTPKGKLSIIVGEPSILLNVKFVITLDTDTHLPRDSARALVGTLSHPLNRANYDEKRNRVCEGYSILQPRVEGTMPDTEHTLFVKIFGGETGIDPYTREVSDVYQDLFSEGSFIGKGIYDVDAFQQALDERFPDNLILSHDLIESCYARSGLVSDIQLYEDFPTQHNVDVSRRHRWIRGDWQIALWLFPRVPGFNLEFVKNPISGLSRWKIFDNLRRSLAPFVMTLMLIYSWFNSTPAWLGSVLLLGIFLLPALLIAFVKLFQKPPDFPVWMHIKSIFNDIILHGTQAVFSIIFLPYEAYYSLDAIIRTGFRLAFTRKHLMEWTTSGDSSQNDRKSFLGFYKTMWSAPALSLGLIACLLYQSSINLGWKIFYISGPFLIVWLISPVAAWWISIPLRDSKTKLSIAQIAFLRKLSRKTWRFFEKFVGPEDHWLPPDNYQEYPRVVLAHRTSPTNMGLSLLANLGAYDFGYLSVKNFLERTSNSLQTMEQLEKHRNHFYNWYDTQSLKPINPYYISTVDSGNLAGHLVTLKSGINGLSVQGILPVRLFEGIMDTWSVLSDILNTIDLPDKLLATRTLLEEELTPPVNHTPRELFVRLNRIGEITRDISISLKNVSNESVKWWAGALEQHCKDILDDLVFMAPWVALVPNPALKSVLPDLWLLDSLSSLHQLAELDLTLSPSINKLLVSSSKSTGENTRLSPELIQELAKLKELIHESSNRASDRIKTCEHLAQVCEELSNMEWDFLYDKSSNLLCIGYNVPAHRKDAGNYDLLASESRLGSYISIAQGHLPQDHWFALGRLLTNVSGKSVLLSWGGSMFEYLMPLLVMPIFENTLICQTCKGIVKKQIEYGRHHGVPWGISESQYNLVDSSFNYQYRAFGVPGLGFKQGLTEDLVIAPYASILALMIEPKKSCENLEYMARLGFEGDYGFYEAIDYTASRLTRGQHHVLVKSFMAHHESMSFLSLSNVLLERVIQKRLESDPLFQSIELLLHERIPKAPPFYLHVTEPWELHPVSESQAPLMRVFSNPNTHIPEVHILSNGNYMVVVTNSGGGFSRWKDTSLTRWREDFTRDNLGTFCYFRDLKDGSVWSNGYQPTLKGSKSYEAIFLQARAEFRRKDFEIETHTEITVSPEDDIELRRITLINHSRVPRTIELTSYAEVVLSSASNEMAHPVFNNLFIQTEILRSLRAIICTRRDSNKNHPLMFHLMSVNGNEMGEPSFETDRFKFIGRGKDLSQPAALSKISNLSDSEGSVLDPIVSIRRTIVINPEESASVDIVTGIAESRDKTVQLIEKYRDYHLADRVFDLAWTHNQVILSHLNATEADAILYGRLASSMIYANPLRRANPSLLMKNRRGQSGLWSYGISGDFPIILLRVGDIANINLIRQLVQAHAYWRLKGLTVDLVIWNEDHSSYRQLLQEQIMGLIASGTETHLVDKPGGIFVRQNEQMMEEDRILIQTVARVIISDTRGSLENQIDHRRQLDLRIPNMKPSRANREEPPASVETPMKNLIFKNDLGGFTEDGREYIVINKPGKTTPLPWINVLANPDFGSIVSESGAGYTWSENAHEFRLTPWYNDPVMDTGGESFYIRDEESGKYWSPTPLPVRGSLTYITRHGFGYSVFEYEEFGISSELWEYVAIDAPVKYFVLKIKNNSNRKRHLSATGFFEWVLGDYRSKSQMYVTTEIDPQSGAVFARNKYNAEFHQRVAFVDVNEPNHQVTGDRTEFLGRNCSSASPAAMSRRRLSGKTGASLDPCAAILVPFELDQGEQRELVFILGAGQNVDEARDLIKRFRGRVNSKQTLSKVWEYWNHTLGAVYVDTPDRTVNVLVNGWLLYQTISCRLWGRSGFYQSGGAFGFRDQLQDVMALLHIAPHLIRQHLLLCASRQYKEGDVQHWWHPPSGQGVRTHISDDYLWLPYVTAFYVRNIGDTGILDENIQYLEGRMVNPEEESYFATPSRSEQSGTLYDHCVRAIKNGLKFGEHNLPLIGSGDWNDGMNKIGEKGQGESVWLAFFLYDILVQFSDIAKKHGDESFFKLCIDEAEKLKVNIDKNTWDGNWYLRAFFDNGVPLGSSKNLECQIDSIPQSWAVLSGAGDPAKSRKAMDLVDKYLVDRENSLIKIFIPPFDKIDLNPGYIKAYVPGVRENGGQYTHAAIWTVIAFAQLGNSQKAWELFGLINPILRGDSAKKIQTYKVEPYVIAADVYAMEPNTGRGGWTWYTGSAGWMYRLIVESLLGIKLDVDKLRFTPCLPKDWKSFQLHYRYRETFYHITIHQDKPSREVIRVTLDGNEHPDKSIPLLDDRIDHHAEIWIG